MAGLLVGLIIGGAIIGGLGLLIWAVINHQKKVDAAWRSVAQQHGLSYSGHEISGAKYGQPVRVCKVSRGSGDSKQTYTVVSAKLITPMDIGLNLRRHGLLNELFHGAVDIEVGDPGFDAAFLVSGDEPHRVRALLTPELRQLLAHHLATSNVTFNCTDHGLSVECSGTTHNALWLSWAIELVGSATAKLDTARRAVAPASALAHHRQAWHAFASANGMHGLDTPLCMWGTLAGASVQAYAVRTDRIQYQLEVSLRFSQPLRMGLNVQPKGLMDKMSIFFGGQDHRFGDQHFDDSFRVRVSDTSRAALVLNSGIRGQLLRLHREVGPLSLDDDGMAVRLPTVPHEPAIVPKTVQKLLGVAEALTARNQVDAIGPYR